MECDFCNKIFCSKSSLNVHQKSAKYCLKIQNANHIEIKIVNFKCEYCDKIYTSKQQLYVHYEVCKNKEIENRIDINKKEF